MMFGMREEKNSEKDLPHGHCAHNKSDMNYPEIESDVKKRLTARTVVRIWLRENKCTSH